MTTPCSGKISALDIRNEWGGISDMHISEYYSGGARVQNPIVGIPSSGQVKWSDYYCKSALAPLVPFSGQIAVIYAVADVSVSARIHLTQNLVDRNAVHNPYPWAQGWGWNGQDIHPQSYSGPRYDSDTLARYSSVSISVSGGSGYIVIQPTLANGWLGVWRTPEHTANGAGGYYGYISMNLVL